MVLPWFYQHSPRWYKCISPYFITNQKLLDAKRSYATVPHPAGATPARNWNSCSPWRKSQKVAATLQWMGKNTRKPSQGRHGFCMFLLFLPKRLGQNGWHRWWLWSHDHIFLRTWKLSLIKLFKDVTWMLCPATNLIVGWVVHDVHCFNHFAKKNFENFHIVNIVQNCASSFLLLLKHPTAFAPQ